MTNSNKESTRKYLLLAKGYLRQHHYSTVMKIIEDLLAKADKPINSLSDRNVDRPTKYKLQLLSNKGVWEDVTNYDYSENEAWTNTGCYRIALATFRLTKETPPFKTKPEIPEKISWLEEPNRARSRAYENGIGADEKINEIIDYLSTK
jgi:hypothetical protein